MTAEADPFGTAHTTERVLAEWAAAPERFREDANAEEELVLGGYRDRVLVELAQNAADAATRAGVPGRLLLRLTDPTDEWPAGVLVAANTGAGLDVAGVKALATLRASAKRPDPVDGLAPTDGPPGGSSTVGRFGVGFSAVLAVTDSPSLVSRTGGVRFSRADTRSLVEQVAARNPGLAAELERREGHVPALRLPFPAEGEPPEGFDTAVLLPLRDGASRDLVEHLLDQLDDALLLALPVLSEVVVEQPGVPARRLADVQSRWHTAHRDGVFDVALLSDRPTEERQRPRWSVTWAVPREGAWPVAGSAAHVVHAPTPTDEPLSWPALLIASFPLDSTRRHVAPGPASRELVIQAAEVYVELLIRLAADGNDVLSLIPGGFAAGPLDGDLREATLVKLATAPILHVVEDGSAVRPRDAVALERGTWASDPHVLGALAPVVAGLISAPTSADAALSSLGVQRIALADLVDQLPEQRDTEGWRALYQGFSPLGTDPAAREALSTVPVPLLDGRVVRGARGTVFVAGDVPEDSVALLVAAGLRVIEPAITRDPVAARLLERLGARAAGAEELLGAPELQRVVIEQADAGDTPDGWDADAVAHAVLGLVAAAGRAADDVSGAWLRRLLLPDSDGDMVPAEVLIRPGSVAERLFDGEAFGVLDADTHAAWPADVWSAVGVADGLSVARFCDVDLHDLPEDLDDLDGAAEWAEELAPGVATEVLAVRDLDLVTEDRWPDVMRLIATGPDLRQALLSPVTVGEPTGGSRRGIGYTAWWLRHELDLAGRSAPDASVGLQALLPVAPEWARELDPEVAAAVGLVTDWTDLDAAGWQRALLSSSALSEPPPLPDLLAMWRALASAAPAGIDPPDRLWALPLPPGDPPPSGDHEIPVRPRLCRAGDVVVTEGPMWLQRGDLGPALVVPADLALPLADVLDVDLASERAEGTVDGAGQVEEVPTAVRSLLPGCPAEFVSHERLTVDGAEVDWWLTAGRGPGVHASTIAGLARGLALAAGRWDLRLAVEHVLTTPDELGTTLLEEASGG
ncbi:MAG TPA: hypothetical protein VFX33_01800 [Actinomycetales bacterium]|nr:hypothetical protein [Actinomycetales bacterium]